MRKRTPYDVNLKLTITNKYAEGGESYASLSEKYGVPSPTIAKWIQNSKRHNVDALIISPERNRFLDVTKEIQVTKGTTEPLTIVINGLELKSDLNTLLLLLQGAKHV